MQRQLILLRIRRPPRPSRLTYTTLFRSLGVGPAVAGADLLVGEPFGLHHQRPGLVGLQCAQGLGRPLDPLAGCDARSEEHTSELQSRQYLVFRLLLDDPFPLSEADSSDD